MSVIPPDDPRAGGSRIGLVHLDCKPMARVEQVRYAAPPVGMPLYPAGPMSGPPLDFIDVPAAFSMFNSSPSSSPSLIPGPSVGPPTVRVMRTATTIPTAYRRASYITKTTSMAFKNPGKAVQLVSFDGDKLVVDPEALALLEALGHDKQISVVTVVGMLQTGKSYLLNRLVKGPNGAANASDDPQNNENKLLNKLLKFGKKKDGPGNRPPSVVFETGSDVNGCTQGIWMYICDEELHDKVVVFLDCEGLGRDKAHDSKLMAMTMLMSSVLIYNSKGGLDESAFNGLSLVCEHADQLIREFNRECGGAAAGGVLSTSFLWVLRDFALKMENEYGEAMSSSEYLESVLKTIGKKDVSRAMLECFMDVDCDTLVQPTVNEADLQKLDSISDGKLRKEFSDQVQALCGKIWNMAASRAVTINKCGGGTPFTPFALAVYIRKLTEHFSNSSTLVGFSLPSVWIQVQHEALASLIDSLGLAHGEKVDGLLAELPLATREVDGRLSAALRRVEIEYRRKAMGEECDQVYQQYLDELMQNAKAQEGRVYPLNDEKARNSAEEVAVRLTDEVMPELVLGWSAEDLDVVMSESARLLIEKLQWVLEEIMMNTRGPRGARLMVAAEKIIQISGLFVTELDKKVEGISHDEQLTRRQRDEALVGIDTLKKTALVDLTAKVAELEEELTRRDRKEEELLAQLEGKEGEIERMTDSVRDTARKRESQANKSWEGKLERLEKQVEELTREKEELEDVLVSTEERMKEAQEGKDDFESSKNNEIDTLTETLIGKTGEIARLKEELEKAGAELERAEAAVKEAELALFTTTRDMAADHDKNVAEWRARVAQLEGENGEVRARLRAEVEGREKAIRVVYEEKAAATEAAHEAMTKLREEIKELKDRVARGGGPRSKRKCLPFCR
ncbi:interferon-induced guanylate-binding protein, putative [Perkinsus marinus ATCC 50983]|uniref:Interferon-induced guanylate-binding protein, putative n=1 Tax=Perkinsus marinus (strain ATCC 50983 / TXsc) TaxID=423536 RepID=C5LG71_PERM5|nr:interferon-induced guanylate-binding protein, putative [Perkinsus marinus ATCC 50983]EER04326.1 interferon-induced guanylate-binding protein, putative [Perkinsus marinus ATCC 50983]|eukprot:XP_002772510.1 interferon-induced guanylate-binding protein, putative [Perkinsus marinus ATCC 50983]